MAMGLALALDSGVGLMDTSRCFRLETGSTHTADRDSIVDRRPGPVNRNSPKRALDREDC
jgi:hypothetical protein